MRKSAIGIVAVAALIRTPVLAADMAVKAPPPALSPVHSWAGFYIGASAGYGWSNSDINLDSVGSADPGLALQVTQTSAAATPPTLNTHSHSFIGGGQFGYNFQSNRIVWGLEADFSFANMKGTDTRSGSALLLPASIANITAVGEKKLDFLGTVRGRLGFTPIDSLLVYTTGGLAYGHVESHTDTSDSGAPILTGPASGSASAMRAGWTAGGGIESALLFAPRWSLKAEYLYYDLGKLTYTLSPAAVCVGACATTVGFVTTTASANFHGSLVRIGLNYKLQ
jgi:outer membrane immunogenic protein